MPGGGPVKMRMSNTRRSFALCRAHSCLDGATEAGDPALTSRPLSLAVRRMRECHWQCGDRWTVPYRLFLGTPRGTRIGTLSTTLIPTLMGTQAIAYLWPPPSRRYRSSARSRGRVTRKVRA